MSGARKIILLVRSLPFIHLLQKRAPFLLAVTVQDAAWEAIQTNVLRVYSDQLKATTSHVLGG